MCGIIAALAQRNVVPVLLEGLKKLEYRGYDSAGIAVIMPGKFGLCKSKGKVKNLQDLIVSKKIIGNIGIGHTRWATHGKPCASNAHPHIINDKIALVHNGIIENYEELRANITKKYKFKFASETDSEVIAAQIYFLQLQGLDLLSAVKKCCKLLVGAYSICVLDLDNPNQIVAARLGSPLVLGVGIKEYFVASDRLALQNVTQNLIYLQDGDIAKISYLGIAIFDIRGRKISRKITNSLVLAENIDTGSYRHFMQKEIFEQPEAIKATLDNRIHKHAVIESFLGKNAKKILNTCSSIQIVACGTSYYAGLVAKRWFEEFAGILCQVDLASEFKYSKKVVLPGTLLITVSQSGETADTIGSLKAILASSVSELKKYCGFLAICNVPESTLVRYSQLVALTNAGAEISVASTKALTTQLTMFLMILSILLKQGNSKKILTSKVLVASLLKLPVLVKKFLQLSEKIKDIAKVFEHSKSVLFIARGSLFPIALEGALKLKELSYIHAEAYPAGELKHGPLSLVDNEIPVVVLMPKDHLEQKLHANIQEVQARGGKLIIFADSSIKSKGTNNNSATTIKLPSVPLWLAPILYAIPMQLLAYHVAVLKGTDVDQPRNLAKSVTVE